jgi:hypothetical protein
MFPTQYMGINYDPIDKRLSIGNIHTNNAVVRTIEQRYNFEKITIKLNQESFDLTIHGQPISRSGKLSSRGYDLADVTCH